MWTGDTMPDRPFAKLTALETAFPRREISNAYLSTLFPEWGVDKIARKTGIKNRRVAAENETALDLGIAAAEGLLAARPEGGGDVDSLLFCTQSPDFRLPPNACIAQERLGLRRGIAAFDFNLGCSGFVYGLALAQGLINCGHARRVLCITAETYSKYLAETDKGVRTIFGDGAAAALIEASDSQAMEGFTFYTDGSGFQNLIVPRGGAAVCDRPEFLGDGRTLDNLYMNGPAVFQFTLECVPVLLEDCLKKSGRAFGDIDHFVMHQANAFMLEHLRAKCGIPAEKFVINMDDVGNTVSSTIPIVLKRETDSGRILPGDTVFLAGFGVGYSGAACIITM